MIRVIRQKRRSTTMIKEIISRGIWSGVPKPYYQPADNGHSFPVTDPAMNCHLRSSSITQRNNNNHDTRILIRAYSTSTEAGNGNRQAARQRLPMDIQIVNLTKQGKYQAVRDLIDTLFPPKSRKNKKGKKNKDDRDNKSPSNKNSNVKLKQETFHFVLKALSKSKDENAGIIAERILEQQQVLYEQSRLEGFPPTHISFGLGVLAWANSGHTQAGEGAERILNIAEAMYQHSRDPNMEPRLETYNNVLLAWIKAGRPYKALDFFLERMKRSDTDNNTGAANDDDVIIRPDRTSYTILLNGYTKDEVTGSEAEGILRLMLEDYQKTGNENAKPDTQHYNMVLRAWSKSSAEGQQLKQQQSQQQQEEELLDGSSYACQSAEALYKTIPQPDVYSYNLLIDTYANQGDAVGAEEAFRRLYQDSLRDSNNKAPMGIQPVNTVLKAWSKSNAPDAAEKAELILDDVYSRHYDGTMQIQLNAISYNTVIDAYAVRGKAEQAFQVFQKMVHDYRGGGNTMNMRAKPTTLTFNFLLRAFGKSGSRRAGEQADILLQQMTAFDATPDAYTYNNATWCWTVSLKAGHPHAKQRLAQLNQQREEERVSVDK